MRYTSSKVRAVSGAPVADAGGPVLRAIDPPRSIPTSAGTSPPLIFFCVFLATPAENRGEQKRAAGRAFEPRHLHAKKDSKLGTTSIRSVPMGCEALENLPIVRCPGCREPMDAKTILPATEELDDIVCVCPRCGAETKRTVKRGRTSRT